MSGKRSQDEYPTENTRHWCPRSQRYAGFDQLLGLLAEGWFIQGMISFDEYWHGGARRVLIYSVILRRGEESVQMRMLNNPAAARFLASLKNPLVPKRFLPTSRATSLGQVTTHPKHYRQPSGSKGRAGA